MNLQVWVFWLPCFNILGSSLLVIYTCIILQFVMICELGKFLKVPYVMLCYVMENFERYPINIMQFVMLYHPSINIITLHVVSYYQDVDGLVEEVQESRRIRLLHQPSKVRCFLIPQHCYS